MKSQKITDKMILGTAQFGMDYGIANLSGKPAKKEVFGILNWAWEKGVKRFDTAPGYGSEELLGEFITANGLQDEAIVFTKIPSLNKISNYKQNIIKSLESSLNYIGCSIEVLFYHDPIDSGLFLKEPQFFDKLLDEYPVSTLGVSVYEPQDVLSLSDCSFELAFQFPFNVLDRRFEQVNMPEGKRYARSIFLQGLLSSSNGLRSNAPEELLNLQKEFHSTLAHYHLAPVSFAISFVALNDSIDHLLIGVDSLKQLQDILNLKLYEKKDMLILDKLKIKTGKKWFDPREWN